MLKIADKSYALMALIILVVVSLFPTEAEGQRLKTLEAENAFVNGVPLRKGDKVDRAASVEVRANGHATVLARMLTFDLNAGVHSADSLLRMEEESKVFQMNDSVYEELRSKGLLNCKPVKVNCGTGSARLFGGAPPRNPVILTDTVTLRWEDFEGYQGPYYVVITSVFEEYLGLKFVETNRILLDLRPYRQEQVVLYKIISLDCRQSDANSLRLRESGR